MTYLVTDNCVKCKHTDCVEVCPVDCFYEGANFLAINPEECIDCGVCEPECPVDAIRADSDMEPDEVERWTNINREYSLIWPVLTQKKDAPEDADAWNGVENKFEEYFDPAPGDGD